MSNRFVLSESECDYSIHTFVGFGKKIKHVPRGWALNLHDIRDFIPVLRYEFECYILINDIISPCRIRINPRLFYKSSPLREHLEKECPNDLEITELLNKADKLSSILLDYRIGTIEINNADINQAAEIFSRINAEGTKVTIDWMVHALLYDKNSNFNLAKVTDDLLVSLQDYHFDTLSRNAVSVVSRARLEKYILTKTKLKNWPRKRTLKM